MADKSPTVDFWVIFGWLRRSPRLIRPARELLAAEPALHAAVGDSLGLGSVRNGGGAVVRSARVFGS